MVLSFLWGSPPPTIPGSEGALKGGEAPRTRDIPELPEGAFKGGEAPRTRNPQELPETPSRAPQRVPPEHPRLPPRVSPLHPRLPPRAPPKSTGDILLRVVVAVNIRFWRVLLSFGIGGLT